MQKIIFILIVSFHLLNSTAQSISTLDTPLTNDEIQKAYDKHRAMSKDEQKTYIKKYHPRVPHEVKFQLDSLKKNRSISKENLDLKNHTRDLTARSSKIPSDASFPGEWEEMQGVFISWPYLFPSKLVDTVRANPNADIWKTIAYGVQLGGAKIYINIKKVADSNAIKKYMIDKGFPLTNYRFLVNVGDDIWARDFGQVPFYYDTDDKMGWIDFKYYPGRDNDNLLPTKWASQLGGIKVITSKINWEGGNIIMDGMNNEIIGSDMVYELNSAFQSLTPAKVIDSIKEYLNTSKINLVPYLKQEGGTGHIDLYLQRADEATLVFAKMPVEMANIMRNDTSVFVWDDYRIASENLDSFKSYKTSFNNKSNYIFQTTLPKNDNNAWYQSGSEYENYTRTYSNSLIVNNVIVQPIFYDNIDGNETWDLSSLEKVKTAFSGYEIVPIDMRTFDGSGGSVHCITKEFPASNPIRMFHYPYRDSFLYQSKFPINITLKNQSGIDSAFVFYRIKGKTEWIKIPLSYVSDNDYFANINSSSKGGEIIEYYIQATSTNGKTMRKPIPAPKGFYTFKIKTNPKPTTSISSQVAEINMIYPIPATNNLYLSIQNPTKSIVEIHIYDLNGRIVLNRFESKNFEKINLDVSSLKTGSYILEIFVNGISNGFRKIMIN